MVYFVQKIKESTEKYLNRALISFHNPLKAGGLCSAS